MELKIQSDQAMRDYMVRQFDRIEDLTTCSVRQIKALQDAQKRLDKTDAVIADLKTHLAAIRHQLENLDINQWAKNFETSQQRCITTIDVLTNEHEKTVEYELQVALEKIQAAEAAIARSSKERNEVLRGTLEQIAKDQRESLDRQRTFDASSEIHNLRMLAIVLFFGEIGLAVLLLYAIAGGIP